MLDRTSLPPVVFLLGKGGVGRSTATAALGYHHAVQFGEKVLLVQWALRDVLSPLFGLEEGGHSHREVMTNLSVMNYNADEAMKEYFVEHLSMGLFYRFVLENQQVQKLIHAAPGLEELFFLGRLFWLVELAEQERGYHFDRIFIDSPATGHGSALFGVAATISRFKLNGPLVSETVRVAQMLENPKKVGTVIVTLPEELPVEETLEMIPVLERDLGRPPLLILLNRSLNPLLQDGINTPTTRSIELNAELKQLNSTESQITAEAIHGDLARRIEFEARLREAVSIPVLSLPDRMIVAPEESGLDLVSALADTFRMAALNG